MTSYQRLSDKNEEDDENVYQPGYDEANTYNYSSDFTPLHCTDDNKLVCFLSILPLKGKHHVLKEDVVELVDQWISIVYLWAKQHKPQTFHQHSMERVAFVPENLFEDTLPFIDVDSPWEVDYGFIIPVKCLDSYTHHSFQGGGLLHVKTSHGRKNKDKIKRHDHIDLRAKKAGFRRVVFLPIWTKVHKAELLDVFLESAFIDLIVFLDKPDAYFFAFSVE